KLLTSALYEVAIMHSEGILSNLCQMVVRSGQFRGLWPNDMFVVDEANSHDHIWWVNVYCTIVVERFEELHRRMASYLQGKDVFVQDLYSGADPDYRISVRIVTQYAWHSLFCKNLFIQPSPEELKNFKPDFTVIDCPGFHANPEV